MKSSIKTALIFTAAAASVVAVTAQAKLSSSSEMRGYNACVEAAAPDFNGLQLSRNYYLNEEADRNIYYVNGSAWQSGERIAVRISCDTSTNGVKLLSQTSNTGRYTLERATVRVQVAQQ
jgi:hypothetical protein